MNDLTLPQSVSARFRDAMIQQDLYANQKPQKSKISMKSEDDAFGGKKIQNDQTLTMNFDKKLQSYSNLLQTKRNVQQNNINTSTQKKMMQTQDLFRSKKKQEISKPIYKKKNEEAKKYVDIPKKASKPQPEVQKKSEDAKKLIEVQKKKMLPPRYETKPKQTQQSKESSHSYKQLVQNAKNAGKQAKQILSVFKEEKKNQEQKNQDSFSKMSTPQKTKKSQSSYQKNQKPIVPKPISTSQAKARQNPLQKSQDAQKNINKNMLKSQEKILRQTEFIQQQLLSQEEEQIRQEIRAQYEVKQLKKKPPQVPKKQVVENKKSEFEKKITKNYQQFIQNDYQKVIKKSFSDHKNENTAATQIQAFYRGYKVRQILEHFFQQLEMSKKSNKHRSSTTVQDEISLFNDNVSPINRQSSEKKARSFAWNDIDQIKENKQESFEDKNTQLKELKMNKDIKDFMYQNNQDLFAPSKNNLISPKKFNKLVSPQKEEMQKIISPQKNQDKNQIISSQQLQISPQKIQQAPQQKQLNENQTLISQRIKEIKALLGEQQKNQEMLINQDNEENEEYEENYKEIKENQKSSQKEKKQSDLMLIQENSPEKKVSSAEKKLGNFPKLFLNLEEAQENSRQPLSPDVKSDYPETPQMGKDSLIVKDSDVKKQKEWEFIKQRIQTLDLGQDQETQWLLQNLEKKIMKKESGREERTLQNDSFFQDYQNMRNFIGSESMLRKSWEKKEDLQTSEVSNISQQFLRNSFHNFIHKKVKDLMNQENMQTLIESRKKVVNYRAQKEHKINKKQYDTRDITPETFKQRSRELEVWKKAEIQELNEAKTILEKNWQLTTNLFQKTKSDIQIINRYMENKSGMTQLTNMSEEGGNLNLTSNTIFSEDTENDPKNFMNFENQSNLITDQIISDILLEEVTSYENAIRSENDQYKITQTQDSVQNYMSTIYQLINTDCVYEAFTVNRFSSPLILPASFYTVISTHQNKNTNESQASFNLMLLDSLQEFLLYYRQRIPYSIKELIHGQKVLKNVINYQVSQSISEVVHFGGFCLGYLNDQHFMSDEQQHNYREDKMGQYLALEVMREEPTYLDYGKYEIEIGSLIAKGIEDELLEELLLELC